MHCLGTDLRVYSKFVFINLGFLMWNQVLNRFSAIRFPILRQIHLDGCWIENIEALTFLDAPALMKCYLSCNFINSFTPLRKINKKGLINYQAQFNNVSQF